MQYHLYQHTPNEIFWCKPKKTCTLCIGGKVQNSDEQNKRDGALTIIEIPLQHCSLDQICPGCQQMFKQFLDLKFQRKVHNQYIICVFVSLIHGLAFSIKKLQTVDSHGLLFSFPILCSFCSPLFKPLTYKLDSIPEHIEQRNSDPHLLLFLVISASLGLRWLQLKLSLALTSENPKGGRCQHSSFAEKAVGSFMLCYYGQVFF